MIRLPFTSRAARCAKPSPEHALIESARQGDVAAFNQLVRAYQELAYRIAFHVSGDARTAVQITQRAFTRAHREIAARRSDDFKTWLLRIVIQECARHLPARSFADGAPVQPQSAVELGLAALSAPERVICVLADIVGLNDDEISHITNTSVSEIRATRSRARRQMRAVLQLVR